jgi:hypothetical protein
LDLRNETRRRRSCRRQANARHAGHRVELRCRSDRSGIVRAVFSFQGCATKGKRQSKRTRSLNGSFRDCPSDRSRKCDRRR